MTTKLFAIIKEKDELIIQQQEKNYEMMKLVTETCSNLTTEFKNHTQTLLRVENKMFADKSKSPV